MRDHFRWGPSFDPGRNEFGSTQTKDLREHCEKLIADASAFDLGGYCTGAIIFTRHGGYVFMLERAFDARWWTLNVAKYPPHAKPGERIGATRRARERNEKRQMKAVAARPRRPRRITQGDKQPKDARELLTHLLSAVQRSEFGHKLLRLSAAMDALGHNVGAHYRNVKAQAAVRLREVQTLLEQVRARTEDYVMRYVAIPSPEERIEATPELMSGMRLESRTFAIGRFRIQLNTWTPIDPGFDQIWDTSLFGVRLVESENL